MAEFGRLLPKGIEAAKKTGEQVVVVTKDGGLIVGRFAEDGRFVIHPNGRGGASLSQDYILEVWGYFSDRFPQPGSKK